MRTIPVDHKDLDSVDEARSEIEKQIRSVENRLPAQIDSPITVSIELQALKSSDNPEQRSLAEFVSAVSDLRSDIAAIEKRLSDPTKLFPPELFYELTDRSRRGFRDMDFYFQEIRNAVRALASKYPEDKESQLLANSVDEWYKLSARNKY